MADHADAEVSQTTRNGKLLKKVLSRHFSLFTPTKVSSTSFEFGGQGSLNEDCNHSVFVVLAGANTTSKFSVQHSHNTSFGRTALPQSTPTMGATPFLIFAFRAISGRLKDMFVEDVQKGYRYHPK